MHDIGPGDKSRRASGCVSHALGLHAWLTRKNGFLGRMTSDFSATVAALLPFVRRTCTVRCIRNGCCRHARMDGHLNNPINVNSIECKFNIEYCRTINSIKRMREEASSAHTPFSHVKRLFESQRNKSSRFGDDDDEHRHSDCGSTRRLCRISNSYLRIACDSTIDQCLHKTHSRTNRCVSTPHNSHRCARTVCV